MHSFECANHARVFQILGWKLLTTFRVIFVMGGPASGKGTICAEVVKRSNAVHVSCGDLLREEVQRRTPLGLQVAEKMKEGRLVDASTVLVSQKYTSSVGGVWREIFRNSEGCCCCVYIMLLGLF